MTIKELIEKLNKYPENMIVVMSSDGEGDEYSPLAGMQSGWYYPEFSWCGSFRSPEGDDDEPYKEEVPALVLWPVN